MWNDGGATLFGFLLWAGTVAGSETMRAGALAAGSSWKRRVAWGALSLILLASLAAAAGEDRPLLLAQAAAVALLSVVFRPPSAGFFGRNFLALFGVVPWGVAHTFEFEVREASEMALLWVCWAPLLAVAWVCFRSMAGVYARGGTRWWPVRREWVGGWMWRFVQPGVMLPLLLCVAPLVAPGILLVALGPNNHGPGWAALAFVVEVPLGCAYLFYRLEVRAMSHGWVRYRERPNAGWFLIEAVCAMVILLALLTALVETIARQDMRLADSRRSASAREVLQAEMERLRALPFERFAGMSGRKPAPAEAGLPEGTVETEVGPEEDDSVWRVRVSVGWTRSPGGPCSETLETLRARTGGGR